MTKEELSKANNLSDFIETNEVVIERYCNGMTANESGLGRALLDINKYAPKEICRHKECCKKGFK